MKAYLPHLLVLGALVLALFVAAVSHARPADSLRAQLARDFAAFQSRLAGGLAYERREIPPDLSAAIDAIGRTFDEYKSVNDQRLKEIEKKGAASPEIEEKLRKMDAALDDLSGIKTKLEAIETRNARPGLAPLPGEQRQFSAAELDHRAKFMDWLRSPSDNILQNELRSAERGLERRAVDTLTGAAGQFAVPEVISREIMRLGVDISPVRSVARVVTAGTSDYKELVDVGGMTFGWVGETDARTETATASLAEIAPTFGMAYAYPKASEESLQDMFFNVESWLIDGSREALAKGEGVAFISGNGNKKPTGFLAGPAPLATADDVRAFGTLQYIPSGQASAMPTSLDTLIDMTQAVRAKYRSNAVWMTNKQVVGSLRKYKDSTGQYVWQQSVQKGAPSLFLEYTVVEAEDMPSVAANAFPLAFGDFKEGYLIVDRPGLFITRDEITTPGYVKFYVRRRVGGKGKNSQAIKLLKIATT